MLINFTTEAFKEKPQKYNNLKFVEKDVTIKDMAIMVHDGHGFTSLYNVKNLVTSTKNQKNWKESQFIGYDIDKVNISMNDLYDKLNVKPSICYTTPSNEKEDGKYCYRLIYVLDKPINDIERFKFYYISFSQYLGISDLIDKKAKDCTRYFNGSYQCDLIINEDSIIDLTKYNLDKCCKNESTNNITENTERGAILVDDSFLQQTVDRNFINDFNSLSYRDFYENCYLSGKYISQEHTLVEDDGSKPIIELGDDFIEIIRRFKLVEFRGKKIPVRYKFKDGEGRRNKLWNNGMLRRKINPSLRFEDILYNLVSEVLLYYDNSDGQLDKNTIYGIAKSVMKYDLDRYNPRIKKRRSYIASSAYCQIHGISKRKAVAMYEAKKRSKAPLIEFYYREGLKPKDVKMLIEEDGEEINIKTVQNWYKKNGIWDDKDEKIFELIDVTKTFRENANIIRDKGLSIGDKRLSNMINEKKAMKKNVFESDEEMMNFQLEMMKNKREREEGEKMLKEVTGSVPEPSEPLSSIDPITIRVEENEEPREENNEGKTLIHNKHYQELFDNIKPSMTWHEKDAMKSKIQMYLYFGRITKDEAQELIELLNRAKVYTVSCSCC